MGRKILVLLLATVFLFPAFAFPALAAPSHKAVFVVGKNTYTVDGQAREMDAVAFVESGRTFVPVRYLAYALGVPGSSVSWDEKTQGVALNLRGGRDITVRLTVGEKNATVINGPGEGVSAQFIVSRTVPMDVAPLMRGGRVYVPARYVAEAFGYEVGWDAGRQAVLIGPPGPLSENPGPDKNGIDTRKIEQALFEQINKDRTAAGLFPVKWDETAAEASRGHARETAEYDYLSHWNLSGKKPQQRYTEAGGIYATDENAGYSRLEGYQLSQELLLKTALEVHAEMMAEVPPNDGHRKNILDPHHTHVGIGVAYALRVDNSITLAFTQEFTNHYYTLGGVPRTTKPGESFSVSGKPIGKAGRLYAVVLLWEESPRPMSLAELKKTGSYSSPGWDSMVSYALEGWPRMYFPQVTAKGNKLNVDSEGNFTATLQASEKPGLNYLQVWLEDSKGEKFISNEVVIGSQ